MNANAHDLDMHLWREVSRLFGAREGYRPCVLRQADQGTWRTILDMKIAHDDVINKFLEQHVVNSGTNLVKQ
jgi:hypothetical protein